MATKFKSFYEVLVGNIGKVFESYQYKSALRNYGIYVRASKSGKGRVSDQDVTLWKDGEILKEHYGSLQNPPNLAPSAARDRWISASAVKIDRDNRGRPTKIHIMTKGGKGKRIPNVSGFVDATGFHPIRDDDDYDPEAVGEKRQYAPVKAKRGKKGRFVKRRNPSGWRKTNAVGAKNKYNGGEEVMIAGNKVADYALLSGWFLGTIIRKNRDGDWQRTIKNARYYLEPKLGNDFQYWVRV